MFAFCLAFFQSSFLTSLRYFCFAVVTFQFFIIITICWNRNSALDLEKLKKYKIIILKNLIVTEETFDECLVEFAF